jgi:hypothetical protein
MDIDEALDFVNQLIRDKTGKPLNETEIKVFKGAWQGLTYIEIDHLSSKYLEQDVGFKLWRKLTEVLGTKVTKKTFRGVVEGKIREQRSHSAEVPQSQEPAHEETPSKNTDFVGRKDAIAESPPENDLDKVVQKVRSQFRNEIQNQCGTLCLLDDIFDNHWSVRLEQLCIDDVKVKDESDRFASNQGSQTPVHWQELALTKRRLMVLGKPGAGKTTLLQHIAIQCDQAKFRPELLPIFIRLKFFAEDARDADGLSLLDYISQEYCDDSVSKQEVEYLLRHGRALILLDGLDEVPKQDINEVLKQLRRFLDKPFNNQIIITCRKAAQEYLDNRFQGFISVEVADFGKNQIETFAARWFETFPGNSRLQGEHQANQFIERLNDPENQRIKELAGTPLLLHLTCLIFQETDDFPSQQSELYRDALNLLLTKWNKFNNGIQLNKTERDLLMKQLSQVAAITFEQGEFSFKLDRIQQIFAESDFASEDWLKSIEAQHGLLIKLGRKIYSFSHQTFQEYLTARYHINSHNLQVLINLVSHVTDPRWREIFLLAAEMLQPAYKLLHLMKQRIDSLPEIAEDKYLQNFLSEVNEKSRSASVPHLYYRSHRGKLKINSEPFRASYRAFLISTVLDLDLTVEHAFWDVDSLSFGDVLDRASGIPTPFSDILYHIRDSCFADSLSFAFARIRESAYSPISALEVTRILNPDITVELLNWLNPLKLQINEQRCNAGSGKTIRDWWNCNGQAWTKQLKKVMIEYRKVCQDGKKWNFEKNQMEALRQYYDANHLLLDCFTRSFPDYSVTDVALVNDDQWEKIEKEIEQWNRVYQEIVKTLLVPIQEID